ncbi:MAG: c-type cytochrome [Gallionella sp.]
MLKLLIVCLLYISAGILPAAAASIDDNSQSLIELGRRIYQEGIVESGEALRGVSAAQVTFSGEQAACMRCHRKSGFGTSEGKNIIAPITGEFLFSMEEVAPDGEETEKTQQQRRALSWLAAKSDTYTQTLFARALREGVNSAGQPMDQLMPRYALNDNEVAALIAYLKTLSTYSEPSVDQTTIHFATVIMPDVEPSQSQAMLDVLNAFVGDINSDTRLIKRRRSVATHAAYRSFREWKLHVWRLTGSADGWKAQLEEHYRQQPVFAVLSGIGGDTWQPLHDFCEQQEVPCLFPNSDLPVLDGGYYSFYFSRGMALEAEVLAKQFNTKPIQRGNIVQVFSEHDRRGVEAARVLRSSLKKNGSVAKLFDWPIPADLSETAWQQMIAENQPDAVVMWVGKADLARLFSWDVADFLPQQIFFSASMMGSELVRDSNLLPKHLNKLKDSIRLIYPYKIPKQSARFLRRTNLWLRSKKIALANERVQANTYFVANMAGDAVSHLLSHYSRDYFIELIEHMIGRSLVTSVYPQLNLGPGQRFASKGAYLVKYSSHQGRTVEPVTRWIVPY